MSVKKIALVVITIALLQVAVGDGNFDTAIGVAQACYAGFAANMPVGYCFKITRDEGINSICNDGTYNNGPYACTTCNNSDPYNVTFFEKCTPTCRENYTDNGNNVCLHINGKLQYTKTGYTNAWIMRDETNSHCTDGYWISGSMCYKDCGKIGLVNCNPNYGCAASAGLCNKGIDLSGRGVLAIAADTYNYITSFGTKQNQWGNMTYFAATMGLNTTLGMYGQSALLDNVKFFNSTVKKTGASAFIQSMTDYATQNLGTYTSNSFSASTIKKVCNQIGTSLLGQIKSATKVSLNYQSFDVTGSCGAVSTPDDEWKCAQSVLNAAPLVDPTGIVAFGTLSHPYCTGLDSITASL